MSQVVKAIVATDTQERKVVKNGLSPLFTDVFQTKDEWSEVRDDTGGVAKIYRIGVKLGAQAYVTDYDGIKSDQPLTEAVDRTKRQVIEAIFGEFRQDFLMIEKALYDYDYVTARQLLHRMEDRMFSTE